MMCARAKIDLEIDYARGGACYSNTGYMKTACNAFCPKNTYPPDGFNKNGPSGGKWEASVCKLLSQRLRCARAEGTSLEAGIESDILLVGVFVNSIHFFHTRVCLLQIR